MKKSILALALCLLLTLSGALAQDAAPYQPGETTRALFDAAFDAGKIITGDLSLTLDLDAAKLGLEGDEAQMMGAVLTLISNAHLRGGVGKIEDGLRLALGATLDAPEGSNPVSVDAAANITWDGVSVETDLLPGERVTLSWQKLLEMGGADEATIAMFLSLRDVDWEAELAQAKEDLADALNAVGELAAPYLATVTDYLATLPVEIQDNVAEEGGYPAVDTQITVMITAQNLAQLGGMLLDQFEQDQVLYPAFVSMQEGDGDQSAQELLSNLRKGLDELNGADVTAVVTFGAMEDGLPMFIVADVMPGGEASGNACVISLIVDAEDASAAVVSFEIYTLDPQGNVGDAFTCEMDVVLDPDDPILDAATDMAMTMRAFASGEQVYDLSYQISSKGTTTDEGLPGMQMNLSEAVAVDADGSIVRTIMLGDMLYSLTSDGGEEMLLDATLDIYVDSNTAITMPIVADARFYPAGDGAEGYEIVSYQIPALGLNEVTVSIAFASEDYDIAATQALTALALDDATDEEIAALVGRLSNAGMMKLFSVLPLLPQELTAMMLSGE